MTKRIKTMASTDCFVVVLQEQGRVSVLFAFSIEWCKQNNSNSSRDKQKILWKKAFLVLSFIMYGKISMLKAQKQDWTCFIRSRPLPLIKEPRPFFLLFQVFHCHVDKRSHRYNGHASRLFGRPRGRDCQGACMQHDRGGGGKVQPTLYTLFWRERNEVRLEVFRGFSQQRQMQNHKKQKPFFFS